MLVTFVLSNFYRTRVLGDLGVCCCIFLLILLLSVVLSLCSLLFLFLFLLLLCAVVYNRDPVAVTRQTYDFAAFPFYKCLSSDACLGGPLSTCAPGKHKHTLSSIV